ncbi:MAG TPA: CTQ-dependent lysine 6-oxidase LodA [Kofleriaceae bacterium]|jgi:L-lysine 6-oxidase|nr:CTQ-dependent lysine 6-oxidase LodA [Kofleriaceae bacterium]
MAKGKAGVTYKIEPSIGLARVGDSLTEFYLSPDTIGGLPIQCDEYGNTGATPRPVESYKDVVMRVKRQGARFKIMRYDDGDTQGTEVTLGAAGVKSIEWTVHIANKKAAWYSFSELLGNLYYSGVYTPTNSYQAKKVELRNAGVTGHDERQRLIIDPGPRTLSGRHQRVQFSRDTIPKQYLHGSFPNADPSQGYPIDTLGSAVTDDAGRLVVIGAYGRAGGDEPISSYGGADTWYDDIADGSVTVKLTLDSGEVEVRDAWVIVGSPKFAPELVNITTLDDILYDVGVRYHNLEPDLYANGQFNLGFKASFEDDVKPILDRMASYQWVANTQAMTAAARPSFDLTDPSLANAPNRSALFAQFRNPDASQQLWASNNAPGMPLNSGTNSVSNELIVKFSTLTATQYFLLDQWVRGQFVRGPRPLPGGVSRLDRADTGNATGEPMSPGIEVTWSMRNPTPYDAPYHVKQRHDAAYYQKHGLSPSENETEPETPTAVVGKGCEPGDLTKRMAIPWQADFFQCTLQYVNFTDPKVNKVNGVPKPPTYYAYWWPPQSPWDVISGAHTPEEQAASGAPAGVQLNYARGINSFIDMITGWKYLGFIHNQTTGHTRNMFPYFVEVERNDDRFALASVAVGGISNVLDPTNVTFMPAWFLRDQNDAEGQKRAKKLRVAAGMDADALEPGEVLPKPITASPKLGLPRNGRVIR